MKWTRTDLYIYVLDRLVHLMIAQRWIASWYLNCGSKAFALWPHEFKKGTPRDRKNVSVDTIPSSLERVISKRLTVCGQMYGLYYWNQDYLWFLSNHQAMYKLQTHSKWSQWNIYHPLPRSSKVIRISTCRLLISSGYVIARSSASMFIKWGRNLPKNSCFENVRPVKWYIMIVSLYHVRFRVSR